MKTGRSFFASFSTSFPHDHSKQKKVNHSSSAVSVSSNGSGVALVFLFRNYLLCQDTVVGIAAYEWTTGRIIKGSFFDSRVGKGIFLASKMS